MKETGQGTSKKALKVSGFRARISTKNGRKILKQRRFKGRKLLTIKKYGKV